jgi:hypothetical protein
MLAYWLNLKELIAVDCHGKFFEIKFKFRHYQGCGISTGKFRKTLSTGTPNINAILPNLSSVPY